MRSISNDGQSLVPDRLIVSVVVGIWVIDPFGVIAAHRVVMLNAVGIVHNIDVYGLAFFAGQSLA